MTTASRQFMVILLGLFSTVLGSCSWSFADAPETSQPLNLADLVSYRAALLGKAASDGTHAAEPPARVVFNELCNRPDSFRGRRVIVDGRIVRIFRQGSIGSFPPLAEMWIASPRGELYCLVFPQECDASVSAVADHGPNSTGAFPTTEHSGAGSARSQAIPELAQAIRFTGVFLKLVRYEAGVGKHLAPLVVADVPPVLVTRMVDDQRLPSATFRFMGSVVADPVLQRCRWPLLSWLLCGTLVAIVSGVIARQNLRAPPRQGAGQHAGWRPALVPGHDPPLEFIEPRCET
jgi:hypothetical protein